MKYNFFMAVVGTVLITFITAYVFWFFWGAFVQYFLSPNHAPSTTSKAYWLVALVLLMVVYDFYYMITLPAILGVITVGLVILAIVRRTRKQPVARYLQALTSACTMGWIISHVFGVFGLAGGLVLGLLISLIKAPWGNLAAEMWDEPWWAPQAYKKRKS